MKKTSGGQTTVYVYDAFGNLAAEYSSQTPTSPCGTPTCYLAVDHLGSTRLLTDANGSSTVARYDYLPFGGELLASINGRTTGMGYFSSADATNPKFTGQVRDPETFLDWYQVRFMSGAQRRFQSPDPGNAGAVIGNPQTWNGYSYVGNNPLSYTDPSGQCFWCILGGAILDAVGIITAQPELVAIGTKIAGIGIGDSIFSGITGCGITGCGGGGGPWSVKNLEEPGDSPRVSSLAAHL